MIVVCDTSVLVAAQAARAGVCAECIRVILARHRLVVSDFILSEFQRKLTGKLRFPESVARHLRHELEAVSELVTPLELPLDVCRDPNDIPILATACACGASLLVSVDKDLLALDVFRGIPIRKPGGTFALLG
jgi:uncharacterized protein